MSRLFWHKVGSLGWDWVIFGILGKKKGVNDILRGRFRVSVWSLDR